MNAGPAGDTGLGAVRRLLLVEGVDLGQVEAAEAAGQLAERAGEMVTHPQRVRLTLAEAGTRLDLPADRVRRVLLAAGLAVDGDDPSPVTTDDLEVVRAFEVGAAEVGDDAALAFARLLGNTAARVAEAAVEIFAEQSAGGLNPESSELALAQASVAASGTTELVPEAFRRLLHQHLHLSVRRSLLERTEGEPDHIHTTVGFVDLVGSTAWTRSLQPGELARALFAFEGAAFDTAASHGGWVVKLIGDAAMVEAPDPVAACNIALDLCRAVAEHPDLPTARAGLATGMVQARSGDYFGTVVNLASRAASVPDPSSVAVNAELAEHLQAGGGPEGLVIAKLPPHPLRGFDRPPPLWQVSRVADAV